MRSLYYLLVQTSLAGVTVLAYAFMILSTVVWGKAMPEHGYVLSTGSAPWVFAISLCCHGVRQAFLHFTSRGVPDPQSISNPINQLFLKSWVGPVTGLLLMINYVLVGFGTAHVRGVLQSVFSLSYVPFTLVLSYFFLGRRPVLLELVGSTLVIGGALISMVPDFAPSSCGRNITVFEELCYAINDSSSAIRGDGTCRHKDSKGTTVIWDILYLASMPFFCGVNIIAEYFMQHQSHSNISPDQTAKEDGRDNLVENEAESSLSNGTIAVADRREAGQWNVFLVVAVVQAWLLLWLLLGFWVNLIPGAVPHCEGVKYTLSTFGDNLKKAFRCTYTGSGGYGAATNFNLTTALHHTDSCTAAAASMVIQVLSVAVISITQIYVVKYHSATFVMALASVGPLISIFLQFDPKLTFGFQKALKGGITSYTWLGLTITLAGIVVYKVPSISSITQRYPAIAASEPDKSKSILNRLLDKRLSSLIQTQTTLDERQPLQEDRNSRNFYLVDRSQERP